MLNLVYDRHFTIQFQRLSGVCFRSGRLYEWSDSVLGSTTCRSIPLASYCGDLVATLEFHPNCAPHRRGESYN